MEEKSCLRGLQQTLWWKEIEYFAGSGTYIDHSMVSQSVTISRSILLAYKRWYAIQLTGVTAGAYNLMNADSQMSRSYRFTLHMNYESSSGVTKPDTIEHTRFVLSHTTRLTNLPVKSDVNLLGFKPSVARCARLVPCLQALGKRCPVAVFVQFFFPQISPDSCKRLKMAENFPHRSQ